MEAAQRARTPEFLEGLGRPGFLEEFMGSQLGSTTHISVLDGEGRACAVTCTNGEGSGVIVPGTGIHLNNMMGEEDLSPLGFFTHPPGRRLPSMMAPTVVERDGEVVLALGSAGSNRIRSAILQVILGVIDRGLSLVEAVEAPRVHWEDGTVFAEPGAAPTRSPPRAGSSRGSRTQRVLRRRAGGAARPGSGELAGAGDPRRGGAVVSDQGVAGGRVADDELGGEDDVGGRAALDRLEQHPAGGAALLDQRLADRGQAARGGGGVVEADDGELARERQAGGARAVDGAERELVGHRRGSRSAGRPSSAGVASRASARELVDLVDGTSSQLEPGGGERLRVAGQALAR